MKTTSYRDLIKNFHQAEVNPSTFREKKSTPRPLQLKRSSNINKQNIQVKNHNQNSSDKSISHQISEWIEEDVLKQYNHKRKDRQLQLSYNKFITYITNIMSTLTGIIPPDLLIIKITYLQYLAALKEMAFIKDTYEPTLIDSATELWNQLSNHGQTAGAFILFIAGILNMKKNQDQNSEKYQYLWKKYAQLRYTRMEMLGKLKTLSDNQIQYPFSPIISQRSRTLASHSKGKRSKDKCLAQKSCNQLLQQSLQSNQNSKELLDSKAGNRRSQILYKMAKQRSVDKKHDKKSSDVQYQKSINQLTFHPKITSVAKDKPKKKLSHGEQDSIDRMIRGRIQRQIRRTIYEKGLPYNQKTFQRMKKEKYQALQKTKQQQICFQQQEKHSVDKEPQKTEQERVIQTRQKVRPPLVLSVQVDEGRIQKLIIHQGECYKEVAAKFIKDQGLGPQMYDKLVAGVENAMKCQLTQIDEDSFQSQFESTC